jgi:RimJ/RimL family protein N-acetyltransferase
MPHLTPTAVFDGTVTLRPWSAGDADALVLRINDPDIATFLDLVPQPYTMRDAHDWFAITAEGWRAGTSATFGIHVDGIEGATGGLGVRFLSELDEGCAEVGYWVAADARGRGIATAATRAAARWAFDTVPELARLQLRADVENPASNRVAEKAGFTREGILRAQRYNARLGRRTDFVMWSLLREEL